MAAPCVAVFPDPIKRCAGCPNGCARPYMAELGFVGDGPNSYQLWLGGTPHQTRLAAAYQDRVKLQVRPGEGFLSCLG